VKNVPSTAIPAKRKAMLTRKASVGKKAGAMAEIHFIPAINMFSATITSLRIKTNKNEVFRVVINNVNFKVQENQNLILRS
jgi:hypothetical protein